MEDTLIAAVFKRKPLWDPANKLYKNVPVMQKLWDDLSQETGIDEKTARAKWKNLRTYYFRELRRLEKSKADNEEEYTSTWQYYDDLAFLTNKEARAQRDSMVEVDPLTTGDSSVNDISNPNIAHVECNSPTRSPRPSRRNMKKLKLNNSQSSKSPIAHVSRKRKVTEDSDEEFETPSVQMKHEPQEVIETEDEDKDLLFFKSLLPYLKAVPLKNKLKLRSKIQNLILEELP